MEYSLALYKNDELKNIIESSTLDYMVWYILDDLFPGTTYKNYPEFPIFNRNIYSCDYNKFIIEFDSSKKNKKLKWKKNII